MLELHETYKFNYQSDLLKYIGKQGLWHQFEKLDQPGVVWSELLDSDLWMIERASE